jgi:Uma2 family endonuclease
MATVATPALQQPVATLSPWLASGLYRFSVRQYDTLIESRTIAEHERVELIEGVVVNKMGRNRPHIVAGNKGLRMLSAIIPSGWYVAKEDPVVVSNWSKPEPDLAVVRGQAEDYIAGDVTAADVALVVEIAESSLSADQEDMAQIYSSSVIPVYWIINLVDRCVEVYSEPDAAGYQSCQRITSGEEVRVVIGGVEVGRIAVADLLP